MSETRVDHREWLFMEIGHEIMDLRQDITWAHEFEKTPYPVDEIIDRLTALQNEIANYADKHFPYIERDADECLCGHKEHDLGAGECYTSGCDCRSFSPPF